MNSTNKLTPWTVATISLLGIISAIIANSITYLILSALNTIPDTTISAINNEPITLIPVIGDTVIATIGASIVYAGFLIWMKNPVYKYRILAGVLLVLSFIYPFFLIKDMPFKMYLALNVMHIVCCCNYRRYFDSIRQSSKKGRINPSRVYLSIILLMMLL